MVNGVTNCGMSVPKSCVWGGRTALLLVELELLLLPLVLLPELVALLLLEVPVLVVLEVLVLGPGCSWLDDPHPA